MITNEIGFTMLRVSIRDIPAAHKADMLDIVTRLLNKPTTNPFRHSALNPDYYIPRIQKVVELLIEYQTSMQNIPYIGQKNV